MFTGLVEHIGTVSEIKVNDQEVGGGNGWSITIKDSSKILDDCKLGDSIAVNGTCLTVTVFDTDSFKVNLAPETLRKTNLGDLKVGSKVNLERATQGLSRYGGHFVQGHVDTICTIKSLTPEENSVWFKFQLSQDFPIQQIVPKGFIALDGTSLTVCEVDDKERTFTVMLIPHTLENVVMGLKKEGDSVNIETDMLGKYVDKVVTAVLETEDENSKIYQLIDKIVQRRLK